MSPQTHGATNTFSRGTIGHAESELFPPIYEIWDARGRTQLAAGVLVSVKLCIYGRTDQNVRERGTVLGWQLEVA